MANKQGRRQKIFRLNSQNMNISPAGEARSWPLTVSADAAPAKQTSYHWLEDAEKEGLQKDLEQPGSSAIGRPKTSKD